MYMYHIYANIIAVLASVAPFMDDLESADGFAEENRSWSLKTHYRERLFSVADFNRFCSIE